MARVFRTAFSGNDSSAIRQFYLELYMVGQGTGTIRWQLRVTSSATTTRTPFGTFSWEVAFTGNSNANQSGTKFFNFNPPKASGGVGELIIATGSFFEVRTGSFSASGFASGGGTIQSASGSGTFFGDRNGTLPSGPTSAPPLTPPPTTPPTTPPPTLPTPSFNDQTITNAWIMTRNFNAAPDRTVAASNTSSYSLRTGGTGLDPRSWLTINNSGQLSGLPTGLGLYTFVVRASNTDNSRDSSILSLTINPPGNRSNGTNMATDLVIGKRYNGTQWINLTVFKRYNGTAWTDITN